MNKVAEGSRRIVINSATGDASSIAADRCVVNGHSRESADRSAGLRRRVVVEARLPDHKHRRALYPASPVARGVARNGREMHLKFSRRKYSAAEVRGVVRDHSQFQLRERLC